MILSRSGPQDLIVETRVSAAVTFIPVAHAPREKALMTNTGRSSLAWRRKPTRRTSRDARRSTGPRTQLVGVPVEPEDSSTTTPRRGSRPPTHRSGMGYRAM